MTFLLGDHAVFPGRGVVEVLGVETREVAGQPLELYVLRSLEQHDKVLVPRHTAENSGLRPLLPRGEVPALLQLLEQPGGLSRGDSLHRRQRSVRERIDRGDAFELATVVRDLSRLDAQKPLAFAETRLLASAQQRLAWELALRCEVPFESMLSRLAAPFQRAA